MLPADVEDGAVRVVDERSDAALQLDTWPTFHHGGLLAWWEALEGLLLFAEKGARFTKNNFLSRLTGQVVPEKGTGFAAVPYRALLFCIMQMKVAGKSKFLRVITIIEITQLSLPPLLMYSESRVTHFASWLSWWFPPGTALVVQSRSTFCKTLAH